MSVRTMQRRPLFWPKSGDIFWPTKFDRQSSKILHFDITLMLYLQLQFVKISNTHLKIFMGLYFVRQKKNYFLKEMRRTYFDLHILEEKVGKVVFCSKIRLVFWYKHKIGVVKWTAFFYYSNILPDTICYVMFFTEKDISCWVNILTQIFEWDSILSDSNCRIYYLGIRKKLFVNFYRQKILQ